MRRRSGVIRAGRTLLTLFVLVLGCTAAAPRVAAQQLFTLSDQSFEAVRKAIFGGLANQVGTLPNPTGGGFVFQFDPALGVFVRATDSFGPVFANRAETTGRGKLTLTTSYSRHTFDDVDGVNMRNGDLTALFGIGAQLTPNISVARIGLLSIREDVSADVFTIGALYGVTDRIDAGLTLPILKVRVKERVRLEEICNAVIVGDQIRCFSFEPGGGAEDTNKAENTGVGDLVLRGKYNFWRNPDMMGGRAGLSFALDVKLPTGDRGERTKFENPTATAVTQGRFQIGDPPLGTGIVRVRPQLVASGSWFSFAPHVNVGAELGTTEGITNDFVYEVGADYTLFGRVTLSADVLGRHAFDVNRRRLTRNGVDGTAGSETVAGSFGIKVNPFGTLLVFLNFLIPFNDTGIRDDVTPTFGIEWTW